MTDVITQLRELAERLDSIWGLLHIEEKKQTMMQLEQEMQHPQFWNDTAKATLVSRNHESLRTEIFSWESLKQEVHSLQELAHELEETPDDDMLQELTHKAEELEKRYKQQEFFLLFDGKYDERSAIVSLYAGSGGTEAQDWASMLTRMIMRFAERKGFTCTIVDETKGQEAGIKSITLQVHGRYAYGYLQSEHGTHRLVRISPFDAESMRHTSFANIEVIPEIESEEIEIDPNDLRIDTFMAGGNGGQSVNTTYSAVRIVHIPTGVTVSCQNEKSQQQNKAVAMRILLARLQVIKEQEEEKERQALRGEVKAAEWGSQIRSYVLHPYKMVKDVRTRYESSDPEAILDGQLDDCIEAYLHWKKAKNMT